MPRRVPASPAARVSLARPLQSDRAMPRIDAVLLDIDGTLVDSNDAHARAWADTLAQFGHDVPFERVRSLIGEGGDKLLIQVAGIEKDSPEGQRIDKARGERFMCDYMPHLKPLPKARELLGRMREDGLTLVAATSAKKAEMDALLELCGANDLVHAATSSDDADRSKPDPDIIQAALVKAKATPTAALMLGDTPYDIDAARRAGVDALAVRSGGWGTEALDGAIAIYDDVADLLARYADSPLGRRRT
jgi:HAD superfamily hydrolase (TIGR01509 family)